MSDTLNSIILDKTCFCNIIIHFEFTCMISKKRKDSVILKEQPFDFMGERGWGGKIKKKKVEIQDPILPEKVTRTWLR